MTVREVQDVLDDTLHNAFPVVVSRESYSLVGSVLRRDLLLALGERNFGTSTRSLSLSTRLERDSATQGTRAASRTTSATTRRWSSRRAFRWACRRGRR